MFMCCALTLMRILSSYRHTHLPNCWVFSFDRPLSPSENPYPSASHYVNQVPKQWWEHPSNHILRNLPQNGKNQPGICRVDHLGWYTYNWFQHALPCSTERMRLRINSMEDVDSGPYHIRYRNCLEGVHEPIIQSTIQYRNDIKKQTNDI